MPLTSCLYECQIGHKRWLPRKHSFAHSHFMFYLDLDEMEVLASRLKLFGTGSKRRFGYRFDQDDYIPDGSFGGASVGAMHGIAPTVCESSSQGVSGCV